MTKFHVSDSKTVIAAVKDPVALNCISKLAQDASDDSLVITDQQLKQDIGEDSFQGSEHMLEAHEPMNLIDLDNLPSSTTRDLSAVSLPVTAAVASPSDYAVAVISQCSVTLSQQTTTVSSQIPLFISPQDLLSLPIITLPVVACSIAGSGGMTTLNESVGSEKSYVTVAAMAMDDISTLPENAVFKPTYSTL